ncbi:MAG: hypothetical protein LBK73_07695 [Treponema sp.]|jgi:hypothetical protein|nr:hypothetical protein [Treponema sp.]
MIAQVSQAGSRKPSDSPLHRVRQGLRHINAGHFRPKSRAITPPKSVFSSYMPSLCAVKVKQRNAILVPIMRMQFLGF